MKKEVRILREEDLLKLLDTIEDSIDTIEPPQTEQFLEGMRSGINIGRKLAQRISYEAFEYDIYDSKESAKA
jgi:hypothetical protein